MVEQRRQDQQDGHRQQRPENPPDPGEIAERDQDHHRVHGEAGPKYGRGHDIGFDGVERQIGGGRQQPHRQRVAGADPEQRGQPDHQQRADIGHEVHDHRQAAPHDRRGQAERPGAERRDEADTGIDHRHRQNVVRDPVLNLAQRARGLDAGAERGAAEQQPLPQPYAGLDHEEGHQQGQDELDEHARGGESDRGQQARFGQHHFARARRIPQGGNALVDPRDPLKLLAQLGEALADRVDQGRDLLDQRQRRLEDQGQRQHHAPQQDQQRDDRGQGVGKAQPRQRIRERGKDHGKHQRGRDRQEHHGTDRKHERQRQEQADADQHHQGRNQPKLLLREAEATDPRSCRARVALGKGRLVHAPV